MYRYKVTALSLILAGNQPNNYSRKSGTNPGKFIFKTCNKPNNYSRKFGSGSGKFIRHATNLSTAQGNLDQVQGNSLDMQQNPALNDDYHSQICNKPNPR
jgi:hypothetical protein